MVPRTPNGYILSYLLGVVKMPSYRDIGRAFEISPARYRELLYFCRQYDEKKRKRDSCYGVGIPVPSDTPRGGCKTSPVERQAERAIRYGADVELIERCAMEAVAPDNGIYQYLIMNVTRGARYEDMLPPCGRRQFYQVYRSKFFYHLDLRY